MLEVASGHIPLAPTVVFSLAMYERYAIPDPAEVEREFCLAHPWWRFSPSFNVSIGRNVPVIRLHQGESEGVMLRWGLIPQWAEGDASRGCAASASAQTVETSTLIRGAWSQGQRCILPMSGFYGWQLVPARYRQPYFIRPVHRPLWGIAGVWDRTVVEDEDDVIESCALLSVPANPLLAEINNTTLRMPAILHRDDYDRWLNASPQSARSLLQSCSQNQMVAHAVSPRINSLQHDDVELTMSVEQEIRHCA